MNGLIGPDRAIPALFSNSAHGSSSSSFASATTLSRFRRANVERRVPAKVDVIENWVERRLERCICEVEEWSTMLKMGIGRIAGIDCTDGGLDTFVAVVGIGAGEGSCTGIWLGAGIATTGELSVLAAISAQGKAVPEVSPFCLICGGDTSVGARGAS